MFSSIIMMCLLGVILGEHWDYEHQDEWPGMCEEGGGQSPVNIITSDLAKYKIDPIKYIGYDKASSFTMKNVGYTVQLVPKVERAVKMDASFLGGEYVLSEFLFHWSSEHEIDDKKFALEAQFVHYNASYKNFDEALKNERSIAVISVLYELSEEDNKSFDKIIKGLSEVEEYSATHQIDDFKIDELAPPDHKDFFTYMGSLTIPDCNENAIWFIIQKPSKISKHQVDQFAKIKDAKGKELKSNNRKVQDLYDRKVFRPE